MISDNFLVTLNMMFWGHAESPSPAPSVSNVLVPANAPDLLPTASHRDISDLATIHSVSALSDEQRYHILTHSAPKLREYPTNSQKRCFRPHWSELFPWIISVDGVFCAPCFLFSKARLSLCQHHSATGRMPQVLLAVH